MSSFADSTLCFTMTSLWSTLGPLETALKSRESMLTFCRFIWGGVEDVLIDLTLSELNNVSSICLSYVRLLSKDSPSGGMKAVVRECTIKGEDKQFLEVCGCLSVAQTQH